MKVKIVYNNSRDKELIELVRFSTPFFVEYLDERTKNGKKEGYRIKSEFGARKSPFVLVLDDEDNYLACFWTESGSNAVQNFINNYK